MCTRSHLHVASALCESIQRYQPASNIVLWVVDADRTTTSPAGVDIRGVEELSIPNWHRFAFQYSALELCCALKPIALKRTLEESASDAVIYLDVDVQLYSYLGELTERLRDSSIVLVPHLTGPAESSTREQDVIKHGVFNGGVLGVSRSAPGFAFLQWWRERTYGQSIADVDAHLYVDQYWLAPVPGLFDDVAILRHAGYNVAYWNVAERTVRRHSGGMWTAGGAPLRLFHFSGFDPAEPFRLSQYQAPVDADASNLRELLQDYALQLARHRAAYAGAAHYTYGTLSDGTPIDRRWRELIRTDHPALSDVRNPFDAAATPGLVERFRAIEHEGSRTRVGWDPSITARAALPVGHTVHDRR